MGMGTVAILGSDASEPLARTDLASLAIALLLGLLVGFQRERSYSRAAGVRTFALITVLGTASVLVGRSFEGGAWVVPVALAGVIAMLVMSNVVARDPGPGGTGITTEVAAIVMFCVGAWLGAGARELPAAVGGGVAILLQLKAPLHGFVRKLGGQDVRAIMQFVLLTLIILPVVPDRDMGPYGVLNPHGIWILVVLIVGMSLAAYIAYKFVQQRAGNVVAGVLGGLISSTATAVSFARRAAGSPGVATSSAMVIMLASTVLYARVLAMLAVVAPNSLAAMWGPITLMLVVSGVLSAVLFRRAGADREPLPEQENPSNLRLALFFGAVYAVVRVATAAAREYWGTGGVYGVAVLAGLVDMDAITLSTGRSAENGGIEAAAAWRAIIIASLSNLVFKGIAAGVIGGRALAVRVGTVFGVAMVVGLLTVWLWPSAR